jgi:hypothetical protein
MVVKNLWGENALSTRKLGEHESNHRLDRNSFQTPTQLPTCMGREEGIQEKQGDSLYNIRKYFLTKIKKKKSPKH